MNDVNEARAARAAAVERMTIHPGDVTVRPATDAELALLPPAVRAGIEAARQREKDRRTAG